MENELIPKADVQAQVELLNAHLKELRRIAPGNNIYLIAEANMSCKQALFCRGFVLFFDHRGLKGCRPRTLPISARRTT